MYAQGGAFMGANFGIMRTEKIHSLSDLKLALQHDNRDRVPKNADQTIKDKKERILTLYEGKIDNYSQAFKNARKRAVFGVEWLFTASDMSGIDLEKWGADNLEWVKQQIGAENILYASIHLDETTPHLHILTVPTETAWNKDHTDIIQKLNCKKYLGGSKWRMKELQDNYYERVASNYGLARGISKTETNSWHNKNTLKNEITELKKIKTELETILKDFEYSSSKLKIDIPELHTKRTFLNYMVDENRLIIDKNEYKDFTNKINDNLNKTNDLINSKMYDLMNKETELKREKEKLIDREDAIRDKETFYNKLDKGDYSDLMSIIKFKEGDILELKKQIANNKDVSEDLLDKTEQLENALNKIKKHEKFIELSKNIKLTNGKSFFDVITEELKKLTIPKINNLTKGM